MLEVKVTPHVGVKGWLQLSLVQEVPVDGSEEGVGHDDVVVSLLRAETLGLVLLQESFQKVPCTRGYVRAQSEGFVEDVVVHLCHVAAVERRKAVHHLVRDHSKAPPVHRTTVVLFLEDLRSEVLRSTTECGSRVPWKKERGRTERGEGGREGEWMGGEGGGGGGEREGGWVGG